MPITTATIAAGPDDGYGGTYTFGTYFNNGGIYYMPLWQSSGGYTYDFLYFTIPGAVSGTTVTNATLKVSGARPQGIIGSSGTPNQRTLEILADKNSNPVVPVNVTQVVSQTKFLTTATATPTIKFTTFPTTGSIPSAITGWAEKSIDVTPLVSKLVQNYPGGYTGTQKIGLFIRYAVSPTGAPVGGSPSMSPVWIKTKEDGALQPVLEITYSAGGGGGGGTPSPFKIRSGKVSASGGRVAIN